MRQVSISIPGADHANAPIPLACRIGSMLVSSAIPGRDAATGKIPDDPKEQARLCFENTKAVLAKAGMDIGDVIRMTVLLTSDEYRDLVNEHWLAWYPDPARRPARHALVTPLRGKMVIQLEIWAVGKDG